MRLQSSLQGELRAQLPVEHQDLQHRQHADLRPQLSARAPLERLLERPLRNCGLLRQRQSWSPITQLPGNRAGHRRGESHIVRPIQHEDARIGGLGRSSVDPPALHEALPDEEKLDRHRLLDDRYL